MFLPQTDVGKMNSQEGILRVIWKFTRSLMKLWEDSLSLRHHGAGGAEGCCVMPNAIINIPRDAQK